jgi:hypothetical protein
MKHDPTDEHTVREQPPTEAQRNYGMLTTGTIALLVLGTALYWVS